MFLFLSLPEWFTSLQKPASLDTLTAQDLRSGAHVEGEIIALYDRFASETSQTQRSDGTVSPKTTTKIFYILPLEDTFVGLEARAADQRAFNDICSATQDYLWGETEYLLSEPVAFDGRVVKMEDELYDYMIEWFADNGYPGGEAAARQDIKPYMLRPFSPGLTTTLIIGLVLLLLDLVSLLFFLRWRKKQKLKAMQPAPAYPESDPLRRLQQ